MEHISERDLPAVTDNVKRHLRPGGLRIMSVAEHDDIINGINLHETVKPKSWWVEMFAKLGLVHREDYVEYFNTQFVRGPKYMADGRFHLILANDNSQSPSIPKESLRIRLYDRWLGSTPQRILRYAVCGI